MKADRITRWRDRFGLWLGRCGLWSLKGWWDAGTDTRQLRHHFNGPRKVTLHSTTKLVQVTVGEQTVPARVWEGETESGIPIHAFVTRIAVSAEDDRTQFEAELQEHRTPRNPDIVAYPARLVL